jgi:hypothetical protein
MAADATASPLAALFAALARGRFPPPDGTVRVVAPPADVPAVVGAVVAFTAHHVVAAAVPAAAVLARLPPGDRRVVPRAPRTPTSGSSATGSYQRILRPSIQSRRMRRGR